MDRLPCHGGIPRERPGPPSAGPESMLVRIRVHVTIACLVAALCAVPSWAGSVVERFAVDPAARTDVDLGGEVLDRITWNADTPAFPGDLPGSLTARYDATMAPGTLGFPLPETWTERDPFTAAAVFVIESDGLIADPLGYFQISWGLWNHETTGHERTGTVENFASDTFELLEFDYYPNVSPWFGGPYVSPTLFGRATPDAPAFPFLGAFSNAAFVFGPESPLPLDVPLVAVMQHRPAEGVVATFVATLTRDGSLAEVPGTASILSVEDLTDARFALDTVGLTLWRDGFSGPAPSLRADVTFHVLAAVPRLVEPADLLRVRAVRR